MNELSLKYVTSESIANDLANGMIDVHPGIAENLPDEITNGQIDFLVAQVGDQPCGQAGINWVAPRNPLIRSMLEREGLLKPEGNMPNIAFVEVRERFRSQGIGRLLIKGLHDAAVRRGFTSVFLQVSQDNVRAIRLYEEVLGYSYIDSIQSEVFERNSDGTYSDDPTSDIARVLVKKIA